MAITIRKEETIERCGKLQSQLNIRTNTGVIDHVVKVHPGLLKDLKKPGKKSGSWKMNYTRSNPSYVITPRRLGLLLKCVRG